MREWRTEVSVSKNNNDKNSKERVRESCPAHDKTCKHACKQHAPLASLVQCRVITCHNTCWWRHRKSSLFHQTVAAQSAILASASSVSDSIRNYCDTGMEFSCHSSSSLSFHDSQWLGCLCNYARIPGTLAPRKTSRSRDIAPIVSLTVACYPDHFYGGQPLKAKPLCYACVNLFWHWSCIVVVLSSAISAKVEQFSTVIIWPSHVNDRVEVQMFFSSQFFLGFPQFSTRLLCRRLLVGWYKSSVLRGDPLVILCDKSSCLLLNYCVCKMLSVRRSHLHCLYILLILFLFISGKLQALHGACPSQRNRQSRQVLQ